MKIKNSFLIPFIFFCCGKPDPQSANDANIKKTEDELKKRFEQDESCKKIQDLNFAEGSYQFYSDFLDYNSRLASLAEFVRINELDLKILCPYDFSKDEDKTTAETELKSLVEKFIELQKSADSDKTDFPILLMKISFLFQNLPKENLEIIFKQNENEKIFSNLMNLCCEVYCKNKFGRSFFDEVAYENARICQREHDKYVLQHAGISENVKVSEVKSTLLTDDHKVRAVIELPENSSLCLLRKSAYDDKKYIYDRESVTKGKLANNDDESFNGSYAFAQIANLVTRLDVYEKVKDLSPAKEIIKIFSQLQQEKVTIEPETQWMNIKTLPACCEIFEKAKGKVTLNAKDFQTFTGRLNNDSVNRSEDWQSVVEVFDSSKVNEVQENKNENYSQHVVDLFSGQVLNSKNLTIKTLLLLKDKSLDCEHFMDFVYKIENPKANFNSQENFKLLFRKLNCQDLDKNFDKLIKKFSDIYGLPQIFVDRETFVRMLESLKGKTDWDIRKGQFSLNKANNKTFTCDCDDSEKQELLKVLQSKGISLL